MIEVYRFQRIFVHDKRRREADGVLLSRSCFHSGTGDVDLVLLLRLKFDAQEDVSFAFQCAEDFLSFKLRRASG